MNEEVKLSITVGTHDGMDNYIEINPELESNIVDIEFGESKSIFFDGFNNRYIEINTPIEIAGEGEDFSIEFEFKSRKGYNNHYMTVLAEKSNSILDEHINISPYIAFINDNLVFESSISYMANVKIPDNIIRTLFHSYKLMRKNNDMYFFIDGELINIRHNCSKDKIVFDNLCIGGNGLINSTIKLNGYLTSLLIKKL